MAAKVSYQWSCDGEIEICLKELVCIDKSVECYHCGNMIPIGLATKLTVLSDGSVYTLHNLCAEKKLSLGIGGIALYLKIFKR